MAKSTIPKSKFPGKRIKRHTKKLLTKIRKTDHSRKRLKHHKVLSREEYFNGKQKQSERMQVQLKEYLRHMGVSGKQFEIDIMQGNNDTNKKDTEYEMDCPRPPLHPTTPSSKNDTVYPFPLSTEFQEFPTKNTNQQKRKRHRRSYAIDCDGFKVFASIYMDYDAAGGGRLGRCQPEQPHQPPQSQECHQQHHSSSKLHKRSSSDDDILRIIINGEEREDHTPVHGYSYSSTSYRYHGCENHTDNSISTKAQECTNAHEYHAHTFAPDQRTNEHTYFYSPNANVRTNNDRTRMPPPLDVYSPDANANSNSNVRTDNDRTRMPPPLNVYTPDATVRTDNDRTRMPPPLNVYTPDATVRADNDRTRMPPPLDHHLNHGYHHGHVHGYVCEYGYSNRDGPPLQEDQYQPLPYESEFAYDHDHDPSPHQPSNLHSSLHPKPHLTGYVEDSSDNDNDEYDNDHKSITLVDKQRDTGTAVNDRHGHHRRSRTELFQAEFFPLA